MVCFFLSILFFSPPHCFSPLISSSPAFLSICLPLRGPVGPPPPPVPSALLPVWTGVFIQEMPMQALEVIFHLVPGSLSYSACPSNGPA